MDEFLNYINKRRQELKAELTELEVAERVYRKRVHRGSGPRLRRARQTFRLSSRKTRPRQITIKDMVRTALGEVYPKGLSIEELLQWLQGKWMPGLKRTSLSPQLTRLKNDGIIENDKRLWKLTKRGRLSQAARAASNQRAAAAE